VKLIVGKNDLATTHPELAKEAEGWDPKTLSAGSSKYVNWICKKKHFWNAPVSMRAKGFGCPICNHRKVLKGFNDLATTHPDIAKEAYGWEPTEYLARGATKLNWICSKGHVSKVEIRRKVKGSKCTVCLNQKVLKGFNDLATTHPDLAREADGWDPTTIGSGTSKKLKWKCSKGHNWFATGNSRTQISLRNNSKCPVCLNQKVFKGFNDLATTNPDLAREADGWDPTKVIGGGAKKLKWKCSKAHSWFTTINHRKRSESGCPVCSNQRVLKGFNDLASTHPELAKEADGWDPRKVIAGTAKKLKWKCSKGHKWSASGDSRTRGTGCPTCSGNLVLQGFNDLASTHPELAKEADGWDPRKVIAGTPKKLKWKCIKGHRWMANGDHRVRGQGCPSCAKYGFDPNKDAYLYFLIQPKWEIYQIGITNVPEVRLNRHSKNGFELLELRGPMDGHSAQELETSLLRYLKSQKADLAPEHIAGKFDGYSESWSIDSYKVNNLKELIDKANEAGF
jgi:hypothetical protein